MPHSLNAPHVGSPDPDLNNSPIAIESDDDFELMRQEVPGEAVCWFNGVAYDNGTIVDSGGTLLRCDRGIWVLEGAGPDEQ